MSAYAQPDDFSSTPRALGGAVFLHLLAVGVVLGYFWTHRDEILPPTSQYVMTLVQAPPSTEVPGAPGTPPPRQPDTPPASSPTLQAPSVQPLSPLPTVKLPPTPQPVTPAPAAPTTPAPKTPPAATKPAPSSPRGTTAATPTPMSYAEWLKTMGRSNNPAAAATTGPARSGPPPQVDLRGTLIDLQKIGAGGSNGAAGGPVTQSAMNDYLARLKARLDAAFENPAGVSGALTVNVSLTIAANGQVTNKRLTNSSGNAAFDAAVQAALDLIKNAEPPPGGHDQTFTVSFQRKM